MKYDMLYIHRVFSTEPRTNILEFIVRSEKQLEMLPPAIKNAIVLLDAVDEYVNVAGVGWRISGLSWYNSTEGIYYIQSEVFNETVGQ